MGDILGQLLFLRNEHSGGQHGIHQLVSLVEYQECHQPMLKYMARDFIFIYIQILIKGVYFMVGAHVDISKLHPSLKRNLTRFVGSARNDTLHYNPVEWPPLRAITIFERSIVPQHFPLQK